MKNVFVCLFLKRFLLMFFLDSFQAEKKLMVFANFCDGKHSKNCDDILVAFFAEGINLIIYFDINHNNGQLVDW
jgi:hypothetical protein